MSLNKVTLIGNIGKDPVIRVASNDNKIANFSIATTEKWNDKSTSEKKEKTEWHNIVVHSQPLISSVIEKYLKKGMRVYLEGSLQTRKWTDKDNNERYTTEIVLQGFGAKIILLTDKKNNSITDDNIVDKAKSVFDAETSNIMDDDEIPF